MEEKQVTAKKRLISQYKKVFISPDGQAVLADLMKAGFLSPSTTPFVEGAPDVTARNLGKQEFVKKILWILKLDPDKFLQIINEQEGNHV